jgi:putative flippase GtrA
MSAVNTLRSERHGNRLARFAMVSLVCTALTQILLWLFIGALSWSGGAANVVAVALTTVPSYLAARHWVWGAERFGGRVGRDMSIFWATSLAGLVLSTVLAAIAFRITPHAWAVSLANMSGFGALWVVRYMILDTHVFGAVASAVAVDH